jgi:hypothetical protein
MGVRLVAMVPAAPRWLLGLAWRAFWLRMKEEAMASLWRHRFRVDGEWRYSPPIQTFSTSALDAQQDNLKECRTLLRTLVIGLRTIVWGINQCNTQRPGSAGSGVPVPQACMPHVHDGCPGVIGVVVGGYPVDIGISAHVVRS